MDLSRAVWRKSRHSYEETACVEVASVPGWRKSRRSHEETACVEVAVVSAAIAVRDSKDPGGPVLAFGLADWAAFTTAAKTGSLDLP